jgi:hypothetical protein
MYIVSDISFALQALPSVVSDIAFAICSIRLG